MINQSRPQKNFAQVHNLLGMDSSLSHYEVRLLLHLATVPPKSRFTLRKFTSTNLFGCKNQYYKAEKDLINKRYLSKDENSNYTINWVEIEKGFQVLKQSKLQKGKAAAIVEVSPISDSKPDETPSSIGDTLSQIGDNPVTNQAQPCDQPVTTLSPISDTYGIPSNTNSNTDNTMGNTAKQKSSLSDDSKIESPTNKTNVSTSPHQAAISNYLSSTKEEVWNLLQEKGMKIQVNEDKVLLYNSRPENGTEFQVGDYPSMKDFLKHIPTIEDVKPVDNSSMKPEPVKEEPKQVIQTSPKYNWNDADHFISLLTEDDKIELSSLTFNQFIKRTNQFFDDSQYDIQSMAFNWLKRKFRTPELSDYKNICSMPVKEDSSTEVVEMYANSQPKKSVYDDLPFN